MTYESKTEDISQTRRKYTITVPHSDVTAAFAGTITELQATAEVRGFRKGKVPANVIKKFFKSDIYSKTADKLINKSYYEVIKDSEAQIVSRPEIEPQGELAEDKEFVYAATVDVSPPLEIIGYKELSLSGKNRQIGDEDVEKALGNLARMTATSTPAAEGHISATGDLVTVDLEVEVNGEIDPQVSNKGVRFELGRDSLLPEFTAALTGVKVGDKTEFTVKYPDDYPVPSLSGQEAKVKANVVTMEQWQLPELNDAFAKKYGAESLESMRKSVRDNLTNTEENQKLEEFGKQVVEQLLKTNTFEVPEALVNSTIDRLVEEANQRLSKEQKLDVRSDVVRAQFRETATSEVQSVLAIGNIARIEGIKVEESETAQELYDLARSFQTTPQNLLKQGGRMVIQEAQGRALIKKTVKHLVGINKVDYTD